MDVVFANPLLLRQALTHRSVLLYWQNLRGVSAILQSNERLEFLGDAVLGMIVAERMYHDDPEADEGLLSRRRAAMVRSETLVGWSRELGVPDCLYLGTGERITGGVRDRMLAGAFEALVGAIYLDGGSVPAVRFVDRFVSRDMDVLLASERLQNPKGRLQEVLQEEAQTVPEYSTLVAEGPDHARRFTEAVSALGVELGTGRGKSKREAQQAAALDALSAVSEAGGLAGLMAQARQDGVPRVIAAPVDAEETTALKPS